MVDASGAVVARGGVDVDDVERTAVVVGMPGSARRGAYTVHWEAHVASDGHVVTGDAGFTVGSADAFATSTGDGGPEGTREAVAVVVVLAFIAAAIVSAGVRAPPPSSGRRSAEDAEVVP